jgi:hypothetical protein
MDAIAIITVDEVLPTNKKKLPLAEALAMVFTSVYIWIIKLELFYLHA